MEESKLDATLCNQLAKCVEDLTSSGQQELDVNILKQVKNICRSSEEYVKHTYHLLVHQLEADHAEIRLGALFLCDELFRFRELLVADFQEFLELTVETDPEQPLPAPIAAGKKLRRTALDFVQQWHAAYSEGYRKLALGYNFLKECKKVDFRDVEMRGVAERHRTEESCRRTENANKKSLKRQTQEMSDMQLEIDGCLAQMKECFRLLVPEPLQLFDEVDFDSPKPCCSKSLDSSVGEPDNDWTREHGIVNGNYNLTVQIPAGLKVPLTADNAIVMENLRDLRLTVAARYLPAVIKWSRAIVKGSGPVNQLKKAIDLKNSLEKTLEKCTELGVDAYTKEIQGHSPSEDDDDEDFEEVESKEGFEPVIPQNRRAEYGLEPLAAECRRIEAGLTKSDKDWKLSVANENKQRDSKFSDEHQDPTSMMANVKHIEEKISKDELAVASTSGVARIDVRKAELLAKAPKLRFDADLVNWGEKDVADPSFVIKLDSLHRFWTPFNDDDATLPRKDAVSRHSRVNEFAGNFEPVKWQCRAPMPSGRLCPRQDRQKCPLHGPIIPRDVTGLPTDPKDRERLQRIEEAKQQANPDWQDPALLADIKVATGIDLTVTKRKGKTKVSGKSVKKRKYPGLTDLKAKQSTSRTRLEKKVLNQVSVKRVAATLDDLDHKKFTDKYANQFNYSCQA